MVLYIFYYILRNSYPFTVVIVKLITVSYCASLLMNFVVVVVVVALLQIRTIDRNMEIPHKGAFCDILSLLYIIITLERDVEDFVLRMH